MRRLTLLAMLTLAAACSSPTAPVEDPEVLRTPPPTPVQVDGSLLLDTPDA